MRLRHLIAVLLVVCLATAGAVTVHASGDRQRSFAQAAAGLRAQWDRDEALGVPAASLAPLRAHLASAQPSAAWWSAAWLQDDGHMLLTTLDAQTSTAWTAAMAARRADAAAVIAQWTSFSAQDGAWLAAASLAAAAHWPAQLNSAASPMALTALTSAWMLYLAQQRSAASAAAAAQQAQSAAQLALTGESRTVLATARQLLSAATSANLDATAVSSLAAQLSSEVAVGSPAAPTTRAQLLAAIGALQALFALNGQVGAQVVPLLRDVDQAQAEGAAGAAALRAQANAVAAAYRAARTSSQLSALATAISALRGQLSGQLAAIQCGHAVGSGKVITISLSLQEMVFYQDGCVVRATPVSTGRPQLRTPTGTFSIFYKKTPFTFISPWPPGSPFYYYPSPVSWVMEFAAGGYFIHDAPWEALSAYGPGSENNLASASHGCVHTPTAVMQWAFSWTPTGTPVVISA